MYLQKNKKMFQIFFTCYPRQKSVCEISRNLAKLLLPNFAKFAKSILISYFLSREIQKIFFRIYLVSVSVNFLVSTISGMVLLYQCRYFTGLNSHNNIVRLIKIGRKFPVEKMILFYSGTYRYRTGTS
jgi:hypothetical protein